MSTRFFTNDKSNTLLKKFEGIFEHKPGHVITGSSNLTAAGLGAQKLEQTYEFNALSHDYDDVKFAADLEPVIILSESFSNPA
jgi:hypothetical protein